MSVLDTMNEADARAALTRCCGASRWVEGMMARRPFGDGALAETVVEPAHTVWAEMERADVLEAFEHHPRIGASLESLRERFASSADLAASEQAGAVGASEGVLGRLRDANVAYEERYGYIFIVCASGKSAEQMLELLEARLHNDSEDELRIAAAEQMKITELRLAKLERQG